MVSHVGETKWFKRKLGTYEREKNRLGQSISPDDVWMAIWNLGPVG